MSLRARLRSQALRIFGTLLDTHEIRNQLIERTAPTQRLCSEDLAGIENSISPYQLANDAQTSTEAGTSVAERNDIVFITSRFRSGSTLLWNLFRQQSDCTAYYEPFNERQFFNQSLRGSGVDSTHKGVSDYSAEYNGLDCLSKYYREDWTRQDLFMGPEHWDPGMKSFIESMIEHATGRPVLQFNRVDFRLPWIREHFPNSSIVHLYRNPRDQWCSFLMQPELYPYHASESEFPDKFYLRAWQRDLKRWFPFLEPRFVSHPYQTFYYLWKLSYLFGRRHASFSLSFEALLAEPDKQLASLFTGLGMTIPSSHSVKALLHPPEDNKWKSYADNGWFAGHEALCEKNLDEFFGNSTSIVTA